MLADRICTCEEIARSKFDVVNDNDRLARVAVHPRHFKNGVLAPGVFPPTHLKSRGLSLMRVEHMDEAELTKQANKVAASKAGDVVAGVLLCEAGRLRQIVDENGARSLCVFDDPLDDNEAHAAVLQTGDADETEIRRLRGKLLELFPAPVSIPSVYAAD